MTVYAVGWIGGCTRGKERRMKKLGMLVLVVAAVAVLAVGCGQKSESTPADKPAVEGEAAPKTEEKKADETKTEEKKADEATTE
jgi:hypothetical protein